MHSADTVLRQTELQASTKVKDPQILIPLSLEEARSVTWASWASGFSRQKVARVATRHNLGRMIEGRWYISAPAWTMFMEGDDKALARYLRGDRTSPAIIAYFERFGITPPVQLLIVE